MFKIDYAHLSDKEAIISLWKKCFPGNDSFDLWFFNNVWSPDRTLIKYEDDKTIAMLQRIPIQLSKDGLLVPATYIYGVCTDPQHRGRGHIKDLLTYSHSLDIQQNIPHAILIPESDDLKMMYSHLGFSIFSYIVEKRYFHNTKTVYSTIQIERTHSSNLSVIKNIYSQFLLDKWHVYRDEKLWQDIFSQMTFTSFNGILKTNDKTLGYFLSELNGEQLYIYELLLDDSVIVNEVLNTIANYFSPKEIVYLMNPTNHDHGRSFAMIMDHCNTDKKVLMHKTNYINLLYN